MNWGAFPNLRQTPATVGKGWQVLVGSEGSVCGVYGAVSKWGKTPCFQRVWLFFETEPELAFLSGEYRQMR